MPSPKCIRLAVFDFDGVFSDGAFYFGDQLKARKVYNGRDSFGIRKLLDIGIDVGIITNDVSVSLDNAVHIRDRIKFVSARADQDKLRVLTQWKEELELSWSEISYMGDDDPDIPCMETAGLAAAPADAQESARATATFVSRYNGGKGAVRDFCEYILRRSSPRKACICIPARLASSRLPSKLLLTVDGVSIIRSTCLQCKKTDLAIFVFTDSEKIAEQVSDVATVFMTHGDYENGTERLSMNEQLIPTEFDTVINVQGDEPFVLPENILHALRLHIERTDKSPIFYTTLHEKCDAHASLDAARVKVAVSNDRAQWYSRSIIPFHRSSNTDSYNIFTGIYVFDRANLRKFSELANTPCQLAESIEQLKILEHGYQIATFPTLVTSAPSVDTYDDYSKLTRTRDAKKLIVDGTGGATVPAESGKIASQKLLDCTLRDGGYVNNWMFDDDFVREFLTLVCHAVDIVEVGFINVQEEYRSCPVGIYRNLGRERIHELRKLVTCKLAVMTDLNALNREVVFPYNSDIDIIRIAFTKSDVSKAKVLAFELLACGYEVCLQFMSSHLYGVEELAAHAAQVPDAIPYVVDSLGCMSAEEVKSYTSLLPVNCGLHLHNNLQQAAGTYASVRSAIADATLNGMGRGAGNLPLELCRVSHEARERLLAFGDKYLSNIPRAWGYAPEYVLQASLRCHPNYVVKMKDMGLTCTFIFKVLSQLEGVSAFRVDTLEKLLSAAV